MQQLEGEPPLGDCSVQAFCTAELNSSYVGGGSQTAPYKRSASTVSKLAWTVEAVKPIHIAVQGDYFIVFLRINLSSGKTAG